jgi:hypothetical protein
MFENKNILLVCKESYSPPMLFLALELMKSNNVASFFILPAETRTKKCIYNKNTYYKFLEKGIKTYSCNDIADVFTENINNPIVNDEVIDYLKRYEKRKSINIQLLSSAAFCTEYHNRKEFVQSSYKHQLYWYYLNLINAEHICNDFKPDVVLDLDIAELGRTALHEVCDEMGIPYITIGFSRYLEYKYFSYSQELDGNELFLGEYNHNLRLTEDELSTEIDYVKSFRESTSILSDEYKGTITARYHAEPLRNAIVQTLKNFYFALDADFRGGKSRLHRNNNILYPSSLKIAFLAVQIEVKRRYLYKKNRYFEKPNKAERYYYMPLHLIPESSELIGAPYYINELAVIEAVSKSLPLGYYLYVKEHQSMLGERPFSFYKCVKKLPNVRLMEINYYEDPKPWIERAEGVITLTGTSGYEAALHGKPVYIFGNVIYSIIDGVTRVRSFEDLPDLFTSSPKLVDNIKSCAAYIKTVKELGERINIFTLMNEAGRSLVNGKDPGSEFYDNLRNLLHFYERAYELRNS